LLFFGFVTEHLNDRHAVDGLFVMKAQIVVVQVWL